MLRLTLIVALLSLSPLAYSSEVTESLTPDILPVARSSSGAFEALVPLLTARTQFANGEFADSYKNYSTVFLHDPDNIEVLFGLADSALAIGKGEIAAKAYTRLARFDLTSEQTIAQFTGLVLAEISEGILENPEARLKQALNISPENYQLWNALGQIYDKQERWQGSWTAYQTAAENGFSQAGLHNNLGMSLLAQKKYQGAISHFKYALRLTPESAQFQNNYRFALLMAGDYRAALENVSDDAAGTLLGDAGYIAMQREDYTLARVLLEKAIEVSPLYNQRAARNLEQLELRHN